MSGGGSQQSSPTPWGPASPYLLQIMQQAQQLYGKQAPQYATPASDFNFGSATGAVGGFFNGSTPYGSMATNLSPDTTAAIKSQLSGQPDYTAVKQSLDAANQQTWDSFNNTELPVLNQNASFLGNPSGSIKDLNWATSQIGKNMSLNADQQYLGQYDLAKQEQAQAAGLGASIAQGSGQQTLGAASLYPGITQVPNDILGDYASTVANTGGKFGTNLSMKPSGAATAANIIGGLTAGAGLVNTLTGAGANGGGTIGAVQGLFGGGAPTAASAAAATNGGVIPGLSGAVAANEAGVAGDVAASNAAALGGDAGFGVAGGGLGAGADAAGAAGADAAAGAGASGAAGAGGAGAGIGAAGIAAGLAAPIALGVLGPIVGDLFAGIGKNPGNTSQAALLQSNQSGLQQRTISSSPGGAQSFGLGSEQVLYQGRPIAWTSGQATTALQLYNQGLQSGNLTAYHNYMAKLPTDTASVYKAVGGTGQGSVAYGGGLAPMPFGMAG